MNIILNTIKLSFNRKIKIGLFSLIDCYTKFEENVVIDRFTIVHKSNIGKYTYIGNNGNVNMCNIGRYTSISSNVKIGLGKHPIDLVSTSAIFYSNKNDFGTKYASGKFTFKEHDEVNIGNDVWIGANCLIMGGVNIGDGAIIGAGSIVTKDVKPYEIVAGVPAKHIRYRFSKDVIDVLIKSSWWERDEEFIKNTDLFCDINKFIKGEGINENNTCKR